MNKEQKQKLLAKVKDLVSQKKGRVIIARELNISDSMAFRLIKEVRGSNPQLEPASKSTVADTVKQMLDEEADVYDIAKSLNRSVSSTITLVKKATNKYSPAEDWMKKAAKSGVLFSKLKSELKIKDIDRAVEILEENFPGCFVVRSKAENGDVVLTPVTDSQSYLERLDVTTKDRPFKVSMVSSNYLVVKVDDNIPADKLTIYDLTDIHVGAAKFRREEFKAVVEQIKNDPGGLVLLGGDSIEAAHKLSVADPLEQTENINEQVNDFIQLVIPISDRLIASSWGNHCGGRFEKYTQMDLSRVIASMLKVPYFRERSIIDVHWRGTMKRLSLAHKYGNALRWPQIESAVEKIMSWSNYKIDCFYSGHNHESRFVPKNIDILVPGRGLQTSRYFICNGGSFLGRRETYASKEDYPPTPQDVVYYGFDGEGNDFAGMIQLDCN